MKIYIDSIFLENFVITLIFIYETERIVKLKAKTLQKILASLISAIYIILMIFFRLSYLNICISKILLAVIVIYIAFLPAKINTLLKLGLVYFLVTTLNLGAVYLITNIFSVQITPGIKILLYVISFSLGYVCISSFWKIFKMQIKEDKYVYDVVIEIGGVKEKYRAFLDTGNTAYSYIYNLPVIFADIPKKINLIELEKDKKTVKVKIEVKTLNNTTIETGYICDRLKVQINGEYQKLRAIIVFKNEDDYIFNGYEMLLNYRLFEKRGGIIS